MLKWVVQKVGLSTVSMHLEEAQGLAEKLKKLGEQEICAIADMVVEYRIAFEKKGIDAMNPAEYVKIKPGIITRFEEFVQDLAKAKEPVRMAAVAVWLHTFRAAQGLEADSSDGEALHDRVLVGTDHSVEKRASYAAYVIVCKRLWGAVARGFSEDVGDTEYPKGFGPTD
jgi:hypothetical protein